MAGEKELEVKKDESLRVNPDKEIYQFEEVGIDKVAKNLPSLVKRQQAMFFVASCGILS